MIDELANRVWKHERLHLDAGALRSRLLRERYIGGTSPLADEDTLVRLLRSAAILSASSSKEHRDLAYQIATSASELEGEFNGVPYVLLLVLARMGNFPALAFAKRRFHLAEERLPVRFVAETSTRSEGNTVRLGEHELALTDFQYKLWQELNSGESVGISAPTSAGKSYILQAYARKLLAEEKARNVCVLVPTRALINQVSDDISSWLPQFGNTLELVTTPVPKGTDLPPRGVYVVTQERMQLLQTAHTDLVIDLMLVDEAQSIADGPRGVLLSSVIEEALNRRPKMQLLFAGPNIRDPGNIAALFDQSPRSVSTHEAAVAQNILFVDCDPINSKKAKLALYAEGKKIPLGEIECEQTLTDHRSKLINLALRLGGGGQNLIYALGPAECEGIAFGLADNDDPAGSDNLKELSDFVKDAVHPKYQLAANVVQRVGFHYGRLPSLVRKAIEDAFAEGHLDYLVTTSTLLYGVNLPAQNLFLHNPEKGKNQPISSNDFWNLAGRAGRLGKEFSGNIFLVDYGEWPSDPMSGQKEIAVKPSIQSHIVDLAPDLIAYINDRARVPDRQKADELENTFVKLVRDHFDGKLKATLDKVGLDPTSVLRTQLEQAVSASVANTKITRDTLVNSPTVSIHRQQSLYDRLTTSLKKKGPGYIIPKHPLDSSAYSSYIGALKRLHDEVMKYPSGDQSHRYIAQLALRWMKGEPLPQIIDGSFAYKRRQGQNPNIATTIRETLNEVERDLRFKYVRLFSCYNAVLDLVLRDNKLDGLVSSIPSIPMYLEVGACSPTMVSFMGLGLSRYTAGKLRQLPRKTDMSQAEARAWIKRQDLDALNLPDASVREIRRMVVAN